MTQGIVIGDLKFSSTFFEGEEREGFYIEPMMKSAWAAQLEMLHVIDQICTLHHIQYFAAWGTLLGTVRHQGFIPWDDDVDICMRRQEYKKFCQIILDYYPDVQLMNAYNTDTWGETADKVVNHVGFCIERQHLKKFHGFPFAVGVDIFIIDNVPENAITGNEMKFVWKTVAAIIETRAYIKSQACDEKEQRELEKAERDGIDALKKITNVEFTQAVPSNQELLILRDEVAGIACDEDSKYVAQMDCFTIWENANIPVEAYEDVIRMPFENISLPVPAGYDTILRLQYGEDYMTPKNISAGHGYPFYKSFYQQLAEQNGMDNVTQEFREDIEKRSCGYYQKYLERMESAPVQKLEFPQTYWKESDVLGFRISPMMKRAWAAQLEVLEEIKSVCKALDITFWADWGTMLGAVRHQGFIPWDDDMDICMMRKDYMRFLQEAPALLDAWYEIKSVYNDPTYDIVKARIINGRHVNFDAAFLEKFHGCPYVVGIDIFPIDHIPDDEKKLREQIDILNLLLKVEASVPEEGPYSEEDISLLQDLEKMLGLHVDYHNRLRHEVKKMFDIVSSRYVGEDTRQVTCMLALAVWGERYRCDKEWYSESVNMKFENSSISLPIGYKNLLRLNYGADYMTPKNVGSSHDYPFYKEQMQGLKEVMEKEFGQELSDEIMEQLVAMKVSENYQ